MLLRIKRFCSIAALLSLLAASSFPRVAIAEGAGLGTDMWTRQFEQWGLFHPHANFCDSTTEVFVNVGGSGQGYCLEKTERGTTDFVAAREDCAQDRKRLPEPAEFFAACGVAGFTNDSTAFEWASNFTHYVFYNTTNLGIGAFIAGGNSSCTKGNSGYVSHYSAGLNTHQYRCLR